MVQHNYGEEFKLVGPKGMAESSTMEVQVPEYQINVTYDWPFMQLDERNAVGGRGWDTPAYKEVVVCPLFKKFIPGFVSVIQFSLNFQPSFLEIEKLAALKCLKKTDYLDPFQMLDWRTASRRY